MFIESLPDRYRLYNISLEGKIGTVDISKALLENGASHTQQQWVDCTRECEWKLASGLLYTAAVLALYANRGHSDADQRGLVRQIKDTLSTDFRNHWMMTSTRIFCSADEVVHNFGYENERRIKRDTIGLSGLLKENPSFGNVTEALLGSRDCTLINDAYSWLSETQVGLYTPPKKPKKQNPALVLYNEGVFIINTCWPIHYIGWARGWSFTPNSP